MFKQIGIGIDIADIEKFEKIKFERKPEFYKKIFLPSEISYCLKYKNPYERFAGKFAIKEATIKAIKEKITLSNYLFLFSNDITTATAIFLS